MLIVQYIPKPNDIEFIYNHVVSNKRVLILLSLSKNDLQIRYSYLLDFIKKISIEEDLYVSPVLFINLVRQHFNIHNKIVFNDYDLFKLRIWTNQLREIILQQNSEIINDELLYIAYTIYSEAIKCGIVAK